MDWNFPPDVHWQRRRRSGYQAALGPALSDQEGVRDAVEVAILFCEALADHRHYRAALESLVLPESLSGWEDFGSAAHLVQVIPDPGYRVLAADAARGTVTVGIESPLAAGARATVEMVWRERIGAWLVAGIE